MIQIDNITIGPGKPVFIVAELSANHNGSLKNAIDTIKAAKRAGADAIKFQTIEDAVNIIKRTRSEILARRHKFGIFKIKPWEDNKVAFLLNNWSRSRKWISQQINEPEERVKRKIMLLRKLGKIPPRKTGRPKVNTL